jgi:histidyl-tRNA synthetase
MSKASVNPPSGFRDFLPEEASARARLIDFISSVYRSHGFQPIGISMLENLATLQGKGGGSDNEKLIFKVMKRGEELNRALAAGAEGQLADLGLRFDLTLPLARYCARFREQLPKPFKVFQLGPVWRADRPQKGRFREFIQCDVDIVGARELGAEADCISAIAGVFSGLGVDGVEIHLNDRRLLSALRGSVPEKDWSEALVVLDKLDKIGTEGVQKELVSRFGSLPQGIGKALSEGSLESFQSVDSESSGSLREILSILTALAPGVKSVFNPTLVRGQDYYTGTIFELRHPDVSGSLAGGGRYNRLLEVFGASRHSGIWRQYWLRAAVSSPARERQDR